MKRFILSIIYSLIIGLLNTYSVERKECSGNEIGISLSDTDSVFFYNYYFLRPKMREFRYMINHRINADSVIAKSLQTNYTKLSETFATLAASKLTDESRGLIAEQRRLAVDYCSLGWDGMINIRISKNEAIAKGISAQAYDNIESWVNSMNRHKVTEIDWDNSMTFAYYQVYFDDNADNPQADVIIRTPVE